MAGVRLAEAVGEALGDLALLGGVHQGAASGAAFPHATVEVGPENDWSHKNGVGRDVRIAVLIADQGASAARLHALMGDAEAAVLAMPQSLEGWRIVTLQFVRSRVARNGSGWTGAVEFRARLLAD